MAIILPSTRRRVVVAACAVCLATAVLAGGAADLAEARARYQRELAACDKGPPDQDLAACRLEARNALAEVKRGRLDDTTPARHYEQNALQRCEVHAGDDRAACEARIRGEGRVEGSVEGGGLLREIQRPVPNQ